MITQQFSVSQITVDYGRPSVRGRKIFGELVPFGKVWGFATLIVMFVGPATGSFMGGFLADVTGNYTASVIFALCGFILSALMALLLPKEVKVPTLDQETQTHYREQQTIPSAL